MTNKSHNNKLSNRPNDNLRKRRRNLEPNRKQRGDERQAARGQRRPQIVNFRAATDPRPPLSAVDRFKNNAFDLVVDGESYRSRLKPNIDKLGPPPSAPVKKPPANPRRKAPPRRR